VPEKDYSHRDVLDKLGIKPGHAVAVVGPADPDLSQRVLEKTGRAIAADDEPADVVLVWADAHTDAVATLQAWKHKIDPSGGIWLLTPKRTQPGYVDQNDLIEAGKQAGVVDNKICSVSDTTSAMRFVIRKADRPRRLY
jgi:Protein of unknown function (DUF3052)